MLLSSNVGSMFYAAARKPSGFGLSFDGLASYVDLGSLGSLGSAIQAANSFYFSVDIKCTTPGTNAAIFGLLHSSANACRVFINSSGVAGQMRIHLGDSAKDTDGRFTNAALVDGNWHTVTGLVVPSTNTITATVDGQVQSMTMDQVETPNNIINFPRNMLLGAQNNSGNPQNFYLGSLDNMKFGTTASTLFATYTMDEGTGLTIADGTGTNTGTLSGSTKPTFVNH